MRVCSQPGCPTAYPVEQGSRCPTHAKQGDKARGSATQRGYNSAGHQAFRSAVLERDPICVECNAAQSTVADHHPHSRRSLLELRLNPDDPARGRGVCKPCHDRSTAMQQPGGWNYRPSPL